MMNQEWTARWTGEGVQSGGMVPRMVGATARRRPSRWWLVGAGMWLGVTLLVGLVLDEVVSFVAYSDSVTDTVWFEAHNSGRSVWANGVVWQYWGRCAVGYFLACLILVPLVALAALLARRGGARFWVVLGGGLVGLVLQIVAMQLPIVAEIVLATGIVRLSFDLVLLLSTMALLALLVEIVALPLGLVGWEWWHLTARSE